MSKQFPKRMFLKRESDPRDKTLSWHIADPHILGLVSMGQTDRIGVYELVEIREATGVVSHRKIKAIKK